MSPIYINSALLSINEQSPDAHPPGSLFPASIVFKKLIKLAFQAGFPSRKELKILIR